jgi:hypothetical protein
MVIATHHTNSNCIKLPPIVLRHSCSIDHCINVELLLIQFNIALTEPKMMPTKEDSHPFGIIIKPDLIYAARLAAAKRLSYSCADIWNQLARWQPWS